MKTFGNILWALLGGLIMAAIYFIVGIVLCVTIIGIPFAKQWFKLANISLHPFGAKVTTNLEARPFGNVLWLTFTVGPLMGVIYAILGAILCVTIIGIPFGIQCFKLARLSLTPFGAIIERDNGSSKRQREFDYVELVDVHGKVVRVKAVKNYDVDLPIAAVPVASDVECKEVLASKA
jgi:uncharacterized membrane protein YccF (DUF307 family)